MLVGKDPHALLTHRLKVHGATAEVDLGLVRADPVMVPLMVANAIQFGSRATKEYLDTPRVLVLLREAKLGGFRKESFSA